MRTHVCRHQRREELLQVAKGQQLSRCLAAWRAAAGEEGRMRAVLARLQHGTAVRVLQQWKVGGPQLATSHGLAE